MNNETDSNGQKTLLTNSIKENKLENYKGQFYNKENEADDHNHEFGAHFRYKDLVKKLETLQRENKKMLLIEECIDNYILT